MGGKGKTATKYFDVKVNASASTTLTNNSTISATTITKGQTITMTANATGGTAPYKYRYYCKPEGIIFTVLSDFHNAFPDCFKLVA